MAGQWKMPTDDKLPPIPIAERGRAPTPYLRWVARELRISESRTDTQNRWLAEWERNYGANDGPSMATPPMLDADTFMGDDLLMENPFEAPDPPQSTATSRKKSAAGARNRDIEETITRKIKERDADTSTDEEGPADAAPPQQPPPPPPPSSAAAPMSPYDPRRGPLNARSYAPNQPAYAPQQPGPGGYPPQQNGYAQQGSPRDAGEENEEEEEEDDTPPPTGHVIDGAFLTHVQQKMNDLTSKVVDVMRQSAQMAHASAEESRKNADLIISDSRKNADVTITNADRLANTAIRLLEASASNVNRLTETMTTTMNNYAAATEKLIATLDKRVQTGEEAQIKAMQTHAESMKALGQAQAREYKAQAIIDTHGAEPVEPPEDMGGNIVADMLSRALQNGVGGIVESISNAVANHGASMTKAAIQETVQVSLREEMGRIFSKENLGKK